MRPWWSRQLEELIDAPGLERELRRGHRYAEEGRVSSLDVAAGRVSALIEGTRPEPYRIHIDTPILTDERWDSLLGELFAQPGAWLALRAGQLPPAARRWRLVPREPIELDLQCSCPVRDLFCKHTAAAVYALAARAAEEPLTLFEWRGRSRHAIQAAWEQQTHRRDNIA